jgi:xylulokinase
MAHKDLVLGYDFGTSSVKAVLLDRSGKVAASASADYPILLPQDGWAEQRPQDWWTAMQTVTRALLADGADAGRIAALALSAQMCGVVPVDCDGAPLTNCLTWMDTRSSAIARKLMGGWITVSGYGPMQLARWLRLTGGAPNLSGKDPISKILWLRRHRADIWPRVHKLLDVKDFLLHRCTGRFATSADSAHLTWLFDARPGRKNWSPALLRQIGLEASLLPEVIAATDVAGGLLASAAQALGLHSGTLVATGMGDVSAAAVGAGNPAQGCLHLYLGTSAWFGAVIARSRVDPTTGVGSLCWADGQNYLLIATQENAGASIDWGMKALGFAADAHEAFEGAARGASLHGNSPLFFPWLAGERVPVDDDKLRAGFANLSIDSSRDNLARAVYEGVAFNTRWAMRPFDRLSGRAGQPLRLVGGGARSGLWAQMFADILNRNIEQVEAPDRCGAVGAAIAASVAAGWHKSLDAAATMVRPGQVLSPDPGLRDLYDARYAQFTKFYARVRPWYHKATS